MSLPATTRRAVADALGALGRGLLMAPRAARLFLAHASGIWRLFLLTLYFSTFAPLFGQSKLRQQLFVMMRKVGVQSFPIVSLVAFLMGAILILQSGEPLKRFGQLTEVPGPVAWSLTREISPLLTAIIMTARVGASFTAVIASMKINEEILALETMAIHPVGYLVAPRFLSMIVMLPCLTMFSIVIGMFGAALVANTFYDLSYSLYIRKTVFYLDMVDVNSGLAKAGVFGTLIAVICSYFGLIAEGGPVGLGRNIMVSVVTSLVAVILADAVLTAFINNYVL